MDCQFTLAEFIDVVGAEPINISKDSLNKRVSGITTDNRSLRVGEVFIALRGKRFDGHAFVEAAIQQGAIASVVECHPGYPSSKSSTCPLLRVQNTLEAYQAIAHWWRNQFDIPVIAVTGSVGKTTTKELIASVLSTQGNVLKSQANFNNEIGVPKTLLELTSDHDYAVIEMGMRARGEIALLTQIARPTIGVITNVGTAHIGCLGSEEAIAQAKCELLANFAPDGVAILNADNDLLMKTAQPIWAGRTITYGLTNGDLHGQITANQTLQVEGLEFVCPLPGQHNALNYLAALAVARELKIDWTALMSGLRVDLPAGRARRIDLANDIVILDETYNAGLESMTAALQLLAELPGRRHIAILGTMKELGARSAEFHYQVGALVQQLNLDRLLILADPEESAALANGAGTIPSEQVSSHAEMVETLVQLIQPGDRLLFKASRAVGLDQVVAQVQKRLI